MFNIKSVASVMALASAMMFVQINTAQAAVFATTADTQNVTFFGSGILTGAPDSGGAFLSNTFDPPSLLGSITFGFGVSFFDGAGVDFELIDVGQSSNEMYDVALSADGISFFSLGVFTTLINGIDINGALAGPFSFIRVTNTSLVNSADLDTAQVFFTAPEIPIPAALPLFLSGMGLVGFFGKRRRKNLVQA